MAIFAAIFAVSFLPQLAAGKATAANGTPGQEE
jgi:hypothetical protein